jgi:hypothetical protein
MNEEVQPEQAVQIEEPETDEDENVEEEIGEESEEETGATEQSGPQMVVVQHKPQHTIEPPKAIQLKPTDAQRDAWRKVLTIMRALGIDEATFKYNGNLTVRVMDSSRVSMIDAEIDMGLGITQLVDAPPMTRKFTCNLGELSRALRMEKPTIDVGQSEAVFKADPDYKHRSSRVTVTILDDSEEEVPEPKLTLDITSDLNLKEVFEEMKKYMTQIPDHLAFVSDNGLTVKGVADNLQTFEMAGFHSTGTGKATFSTTFLQAMAKDDWDIAFANDMPMKATRTITKSDYVGTGRDMKQVTTIVANLKVYLAPRIETE